MGLDAISTSSRGSFICDAIVESSLFAYSPESKCELSCVSFVLTLLEIPRRRLTEDHLND